MKLAFVAPFQHSYGTEEHVARAWEQIGVGVIRIPEAAATATTIEATAVDHDVDLVCYMKSHGLPSPDEVVKVWRRLEARGVVTFSHHLDLYRGLPRAVNVTTDDPFWAMQHAFTADGDPISAEWFAGLGINHHWLPPAVDEQEARPPGTWCAAFDRDVAFVGAGSYPHQVEWAWRATLLAGLTNRYGDRFERWGNGSKVVRGQWLNDLYATVKVAVGDSTCLLDGPNGGRHQRYWSDRIVESLGRGATLIFPDVPGLADYYGLEDGVHCQFYEYGDLTGIYQAVDELLADPAGAEAMAKRGWAQIVEGGHTYKDRVQEILDVLDTA